MLEKLSRHSDPNVRTAAIEALQLAAAARAERNVRSDAPRMSSIPSVSGSKERSVYDMKERAQWYLPGKLARAEGDPAVQDPAVNEAFDYSGNVYDFYSAVLGRNSLDNRGMALVSSVHVGKRFNNAFWNGEQMAYGDGDGTVFTRFTKSLDVVAHELTHGVVTHTCNLEYQDESGALNEHFADVFGLLVKQSVLKQDVTSADWLVGHDVLVARPTVRALRSFDANPAYTADPWLGDDPQPKHLSGKYTGPEDYGGVHLNSGIPNHAFYLFATSLGGNAWETPGHIWYKAMQALHSQSNFSDIVRETVAIATQTHGAGSKEVAALGAAWGTVGL